MTSPSSVNNYTETAATYDSFRLPQGAGLLVDAAGRAAARLRRPLEELTLLAAGCGTGNYEKAMLNTLHRNGAQPGRLILLDAFPEMLEQAAAKLGPSGVTLEQHVADLVTDEMPVSRESVHYMTLVEVIHHFDFGNKLHPRLEQVLKKCYETLAPGGALSIISTTPSQSVRSRYYQFVGEHAGIAKSEDPGRLYAARYPRLELVLGMLRRVGFDLGASASPQLIQGPYIRPEVYYEPEALLAAGPGAVSFFKLARDSNLYASYERAFRSLLDSGKIRDVIDESEEFRRLMGTSYCITVYKPFV